MWQDIGRRAAHLGLPNNVPVPYPLKEFDLSNQVAIVAQRGGWLVDYAQAMYTRWFRDKTEPGSDPNLRETLVELGHDPDDIVAEARSAEVMQALDAVTAEARGKGIFGAPTFVVGREHFWGDDKLEDAISWSLNGRLPIVTWT